MSSVDLELLRHRPHEFFCSACRHELHHLCERECPFCGAPCLCPHATIPAMRNLPPWALAAIVVGLAALAVIIAFTGAAAASPCRVDGVAPFVAPDNGCTPGAFVPKTRHDVCDGDTDRPSLPAAERRAMLRNYGVPGWTAADGEIDHRVPLVLGGTTDRRNLWPEAGPDPRRGQNQKDRLEAAIYRRVCFGVPYAMRVRTAVLLFMSDWRPAYTYYVLGIGPRVLPR